MREVLEKFDLVHLFGQEVMPEAPAWRLAVALHTAGC
jgi:hypothetical protein